MKPYPLYRSPTGLSDHPLSYAGHIMVLLVQKPAAQVILKGGAKPISIRAEESENAERWSQQK